MSLVVSYCASHSPDYSKQPSLDQCFISYLLPVLCAFSKRRDGFVLPPCSTNHLSFLPLICQSIGWPIDPTHGFTQLPFNTSFYHIQKPYNLRETDRYSFFSGIHKLRVYSTDKPLSKNSPTKPRTEIIISVEH
jgi:hypothetical protein